MKHDHEIQDQAQEIQPTDHTDDCAGYEKGDECYRDGAGLLGVPGWDRVPEIWIRKAEGEMEAGVPWCRVRERALELMAEEEGGAR